MTAQNLPTRRWTAVTLALALVDTVAGCHGGEIVFGMRGDRRASAGQGGETGSAGSRATGGDGTPEAGAAGSSPAPTTVELVTSAPDAYWKTDAAWTEVSSEPADVIVDDQNEAQVWEGFGGAFNELGWVYLSTQALRDEAMALLFGPEGCRLAWGALPIGANDYAVDRYTLDESPGDTSMSHFSIERDRQRLIPYIRAALETKPDIRFWARPWTPPTWMKTGQKAGDDPSPFDGGRMLDDDAILSAYARYLVKFVQAYAEEGIAVDVVAPQNEPSYAENYPSCVWTASLYTKFVGQYLGPAFDAAGIATRIMLGTMSNAKTDPSILDSVMADSAASGTVDLIGLQWGMLDVIANARSKGLPLWQTEHQCGNYPWEADYRNPAPNDHAYGVESWGLIRDWIRAGVSAYFAWNMVLDPAGQSIDSAREWAQNALLVADGSRLIKTPAYYVFRHLSRFVVPGAKVVGTTGGDALAFKNPDRSIVTVLYNAAAARKTVVLVDGRKLEFDVPGNGWATVRYVP
jgi:glucosylceramidase